MKSNVFKKAHELTKKIIKKGDNYRATFRLCLLFVYSQIKKGVAKMVELKGTEKQVKWAEDLRSSFIKYVDFAKEIVEEIGITKYTLEDLEDEGFDNIEEAFEIIEKQENAGKIISALKDYSMLKDIEKHIEKEKNKLEAYAQRHTKEATIQEKDTIVGWTIQTLAEIK